MSRRKRRQSRRSRRPPGRPRASEGCHGPRAGSARQSPARWAAAAGRSRAPHRGSPTGRPASRPTRERARRPSPPRQDRRAPPSSAPAGAGHRPRAARARPRPRAPRTRPTPRRRTFRGCARRAPATARARPRPPRRRPPSRPPMRPTRSRHACPHRTRRRILGPTKERETSRLTQRQFLAAALCGGAVAAAAWLVLPWLGVDEPTGKSGGTAPLELRLAVVDEPGTPGARRRRGVRTPGRRALGRVAPGHDQELAVESRAGDGRV